MTMAWVGIGSAVVGAAGSYMSAKEAGKGGPAPQALPSPVGPGGVMSNNMSGWTDPNTGLTTMYDNGFDPSSMGQYWDNQAAYNQFMGRGNSGITNTIDWQLKKLQQQYDQMSQQGAKAGNVPSQFQGMQKFLDDKGNPPDISDTNAIFDGRISTPQAKALVAQFQQDTGGNYGGGGAIGFGKWVRDFNQKSLAPAVEAFKKTQGVQEGNTQTSTAALNDLKNQIDFLTQQKSQYGGDAPAGGQSGSSAGQNPFDPFLKDLGAKWQGDMNNTNPNAEGWQGMYDKSLDQAMNADPTEFMREYLGTMTDPAERERVAAEFQAKLEGRINGANVDVQRIDPAKLDLTAASAQESADNFRAAQGTQAQQELLRQRLGNRGMSALGEIQAAGAGQNLVGQQLANAASARGGYNDAVTKNFGMEAQAAGQNNDAALRAGALGLQGTNLLASNYNQNQGNLFGQGMQQAGFAQSLKDNWFKQAQSALGTSNAMRAEDRSWDLQDYQNKLNENQALYGRTNDQYNRLTGASQQAFQNQLNTRAANQGQYNALNGTNMTMAGWNNEANVANAQMQNSWEAANAQREAASNAAMWQGGANAISAGLNAYGQYQGNKPKNQWEPGKNLNTGGYGMGTGGGSGYGVD